MTEAFTENPQIVLLPHPLKQKIKDGLVAVSLANLCFIRVTFDLLSDQDRYFDKLPVTSMTCVTLALNLLWLTLGIWFIIRLWHRSTSHLTNVVVHFGFLFLLLFPADFIRTKYLSIADYQVLAFVSQPAVILCSLALLAFSVWQCRYVDKLLAAFVGILSPLAVFMIVKLMLVLFGILHLKQCESQFHPAPFYSVYKGEPRILWIIFDETDYRLAFEQRPDNVKLPEFDRLQNESLFATDAYPPGNYTLISMPSLIMGRRLSAVSADDACDLTVTFADTAKTAEWSTLPSVFSQARALGFNTALVGWYHPYSRILNGALNFCAWYPLPSYEPARAETFGAEMCQQIESLTGTFHNRQLIINLYHNSLKASLSLVTNSDYGLTLLHLFPPHKPGVWLPGKNRFTVFGMPKTSGYFNNLALADRTLGILRRAMETSGEWNKTWIIVSTDHSWRESKLYDGKRDYRVPFLIKSPGENESLTYPQEFNTVLTHDLILAILRGEVTNEQNVVNWLDTHRSTQDNIPTTSSNVE